MFFLIIQVHGLVGAILYHQSYGVRSLGNGFLDFFAVFCCEMTQDVGSQVVVFRLFAHAHANTLKFLGAQVSDNILDAVMATGAAFFADADVTGLQGNAS